MRRRKPHRTAADDGYAIGHFRHGRPPHFQRMPRLRPIPFGEKTLQRTNRDGAVDFAAAASSFTGVCAHAAADTRHRVRIPRIAVSFLKTPLGNERHIAAGIGPCRTSHHAREVRIQPFPVDSLVLETIQHAGLSRLWAVPTGTLYLDNVKSTVAAPATVTGLDCVLKPSCQPVTV